jgi:hypothetical protein
MKMCTRSVPDRSTCAAKAPRKRRRRAVDGRTSPARRYASLVAGFKVEIGGVLTLAEIGLIETAAMLKLRSEQLTAEMIAGKPVDNGEIIRLAGASRRALSKITAKAKNPAASETLNEYLARKGAEKAALEAEALADDDDDGEE